MGHLIRPSWSRHLHFLVRYSRPEKEFRRKGSSPYKQVRLKTFGILSVSILVYSECLLFVFSEFWNARNVYTSDLNYLSVSSKTSTSALEIWKPQVFKSYHIVSEHILLYFSFIDQTSFSGMLKVVMSEPPFRDQPKLCKIKTSSSHPISPSP